MCTLTALMLVAALCQTIKPFYSVNDMYQLLPNKLRHLTNVHVPKRHLCIQTMMWNMSGGMSSPSGWQWSYLLISALWRLHTWGAGDGKLTPSSLRVFIVELRRLSCGSFWKSSAHSTISAFSFSHTLEWACSTKIKVKSSPLFPKGDAFPESPGA